METENDSGSTILFKITASNYKANKNYSSKYLKLEFISISIWSKVQGLFKITFSGLPMEVYLILIHIVLFSSDNIEAGDILVNKKEVENIQTNYMLFLHRSD